MCHLSLLGCPSRNSLPQSTRNPPAIHAQANPTLRPRPCPPPCSVFRLGFFPPTFSSHKKPRQKHQTPTHRPQGRVCFIPHTHSACSGVLGVCMLIVVRLASFPPVETFLSSHKATLHGFRSRGIVVRVAGGGGGSGGSVVLVARRGSSALYWWQRGYVFCPCYVIAFCRCLRNSPSAYIIVVISFLPWVFHWLLCSSWFLVASWFSLPYGVFVVWRSFVSAVSASPSARLLIA